jgi:hypothetical protein
VHETTFSSLIRLDWLLRRDRQTLQRSIFPLFRVTPVFMLRRVNR